MVGRRVVAFVIGSPERIGEYLGFPRPIVIAKRAREDSSSLSSWEQDDCHGILNHVIVKIGSEFAPTDLCCELVRRIHFCRLSVTDLRDGMF